MAAPESSNLSSSFFHTYKELFEYERHVGSEDPVVLSQRDCGGVGTKSFLDKYKECEHRQVIESRASLQLPLTSMLMVDTRAQLGPLIMPCVSSSTTLKEQWKQQSEKSHQQTIPLQQVSPSFMRSKLEKSLRQSLSNQEEIAPPWSIAPYYLNAAQVPEKQASPTKIVVPSVPATLPVNVTKSHTHTLHADRSSPQFQPPKLAELLIDSSTRPATLRHRHLDETKKIEQLIGNSCGGRISSVSTNLPPSIRRRLQASTRVEQRREQLYAVLRQEYHSLCHQQ